MSMSLDEENREIVESFRTYIEDSLSADERYGSAERFDQEDESALATRFHAGPSCWLEFAIHPMVPQIRVSFATSDRWVSDELEQTIQDSGDSMSEFLSVGLSEAGLDWEDPPVEHYREGEQNFYFATPLDLEELVDLEFDEPRGKVLRMLEGYMIAFGPALILECEEGEDYDGADQEGEEEE